MGHEHRILLGKEAMNTYIHIFDSLGVLFQSCGVEESLTKATPPTSCMTYLGIEFDWKNMELRVPPSRLDLLETELPAWLERTEATQKEIQSPIGHLLFVSKCVKPGRIFVSRLLDKLRGHPSSDRNRVIQLDIDFYRDINWWCSFLKEYNSVSMIKTAKWSGVDIIFATDACLVGCGGVCGDFFYHSPFPDFIRERGLSIAGLEALAVVVALRIWGREWHGQKISFACDNWAVVQVINSGRAKDPFLLSCLREICYICAIFEFEVFAVHIEGKNNRLPDLLSRWDLDPNNQTSFFDMSGFVREHNVFVPKSYFLFSHNW